MQGVNDAKYFVDIYTFCVRLCDLYPDIGPLLNKETNLFCLLFPDELSVLHIKFPFSGTS